MKGLPPCWTPVYYAKIFSPSDADRTEGKGSGKEGSHSPAPPLSRHPLRTCPRAMSLEEILLPVRPTTLRRRSKLPAKPRINSECIQCNSEYFLSGAFAPSLSPLQHLVSAISLPLMLPLGMMHLRRYDLYVRQPALPCPTACVPSKEKAKRRRRRGKGAARASERVARRLRRPRDREGERKGWMMLYCFELVMLRQRARVMGCAERRYDTSMKMNLEKASI